LVDIRGIPHLASIATRIFPKPLDLPLLFAYSASYACSLLPQVLRGLLQEMRPRRVSRNRYFPGQLYMRGLLPMWREAAIPALGSHPWQTAFRDSQKELPPPPATSREWPAQLDGYCGKGASLIVLPSCADCLAASRICITTTLVSSEVRSPDGFSVPRSTAAR
jgi:hypothetical protein